MPGIDRPQVFFYCTSLSTGSVCSFGRSGFMWDDQDIERSIVAPSTPVAFAVAASSAFPPLFPPIAISNNVLSCDIQDFPNPLYLTDGGVYDNLGIDRLVWYHRQNPDIDTFIVSDAEGNFDWDFESSYSLITSRNIRASDILMKRVSALQYQAYSSAAQMFVIDIDTELQRPGDPAILSPGDQRKLRNVRTDLDEFSPTEIRYLIWHGYAVAREILIERGLVPATAPTYSWEPLPNDKKLPREEASREVHKSRYRKLRLWSFRDKASLASLLIIVSILTVIFFPLYLRHRALTAEAAKVQEYESKLAVKDSKLQELGHDLRKQQARTRVDVSKPVPPPDPFPIYVTNRMITSCKTRGNVPCGAASVVLNGVAFNKGVIYTQPGEGFNGSSHATFNVPHGARSLSFSVGDPYEGADCRQDHQKKPLLASVEIDGAVVFGPVPVIPTQTQTVAIPKTARQVTLVGNTGDGPVDCDDGVWVNVSFDN